MRRQRRWFLKQTASTLACVCLARDLFGEVQRAAKGGYRIEGSKLIIDLSKYPKLKETGGAADFGAGDVKVIVIHPEEQEYKAFENKCTHQGGTVVYRPKVGVMRCTRHGSEFDTDGKVVKSPALRPLPEFGTSINGDELTVYLA